MKVEVAVVGSPSLIVLMVSVDVKLRQHLKRRPVARLVMERARSDQADL